MKIASNFYKYTRISHFGHPECSNDGENWFRVDPDSVYVADSTVDNAPTPRTDAMCRDTGTYPIETVLGYYGDFARQLERELKGVQVALTESKTANEMLKELLSQAIKVADEYRCNDDNPHNDPEKCRCKTCPKLAQLICDANKLLSQPSA